jgi:hypothetical protein
MAIFLSGGYFPVVETIRSLRLINSDEQRNFADGTERWMGGTKRWRSRSRGVLGQASLLVNGSGPLAGSLAWGRAVSTRWASTQAEWRRSQREVKSAKFGCEMFRLSGINADEEQNV